mgnify:CR=1 FL=1
MANDRGRVAAVFEQGDHISDLPFVDGGGFELVEELDTIASSLAASKVCSPTRLFS